MVTTLRNYPTPTYLTNGRVAWEIGVWRIASLYRQGYYLPPERWGVHTGKLDWKPGVCGELRKESDLCVEQRP